MAEAKSEVDDWETIARVVTTNMDEEATVAEVVPPRSAELNRRGSLNRMVVNVADHEAEPLKRAESINYDKDHDVHISPDKLTNSSELLSILQRATLESLKLIRLDEHDETKDVEDIPPLSGAPLFDSVDSAKQLLAILKIEKKDLSEANKRTCKKEYYEQLRETVSKSSAHPPHSPFVTTRHKHSPTSPARKSGISVVTGGPTEPGSPTVPSPRQLHSPKQGHPGRRRSSKNMRVEKKEEEATVAEVVPPRAAELFRRNSFTRKAMLEGVEGITSPTEPPAAVEFPSPAESNQKKAESTPAPSPAPSPAPPSPAPSSTPVTAGKPSPCCEVQ